ncbi:MAG: CAP domain-containing protein [Eubacterium sp.]|nr:CAP domain-containing protein [Eubacterium sp.]
MAKRYPAILRLVFITVFFVAFLGCRQVFADLNVTFSVTYQQSSARNVTEYVNQLRTAGSWYWNSSDSGKINTGKLSALTYDYELEKAAMQRAAEIALYYDHTRPNGQAYSTAYSGSTMAENIAVGYETASEVYAGWLEENESYAGQGHRRNMLGSGFTAIGIGHVVCNGIHYWVMELRNPVAYYNNYTDPVNSERSVTVQTATGYIDKVELYTNAPDHDKMTVGEKYTMMPKVFVVGKNASGSRGRVPVSATFSVSVNDTSVISYESVGSGQYRLTANKAGSTSVTVNGTSSYSNPLSVTFTIVVGQVSMDYVDISLDKTEYVWNGSAVCPKPVLTWHGEVLREDIDYTLSYLRNDGCTRNNGGAIVSAFAVSGGRFKDFRSIGFQILAANIADQKITLSPSEFVYDGWTKEPEVIIPGLVKDKDFRVEYENNRMAGTAKAIVTGIGNYTGRTSVSFKIKSKSSDTDGSGSNPGTVKPKKPVISSAVNLKGKKIKVTWKKVSGVTGYRVRYQTGKTVKTVKVKKASAKSKTLTKLKKGKTYTIKVQSYKTSGGSTVYSKWSKAKKVKVKK